jgi:hypothetical protein
MAGGCGSARRRQPLAEKKLTMFLAFATLAALAVVESAPSAPLTLLTDSRARCMDGSLSGY